MNLQEAISKKEPYIESSSLELLDLLTCLKRKHQFQMLLDIVAIDNQERGGNSDGRFELVYFLLSMEHHHRLGVRITLEEDDIIPSIDKIWPNASRLEHEVWDMMGIKFDEERTSRVLTHSGFSGYPLRKDFVPTKFKKANMVDKINLDNYLTITPNHPAMEGALKLSVQLDGEMIRGCVLEAGYLHRGIEKISESRNYNQIIPLVERLNHNSSAMNGIGWVKAVEGLLETDVSDRSKVLRMIFFELSRMFDHLSVINKIAHSVESSAIYTLSSKQIDVISSLFRSYGSDGLHGNIARVGGMCRDIPMGWISECYEKIQILHENIYRIYKKMVKSRIWMERTRVCSLSPQRAIEFGCTGPCLRACGINYDIRKASPYYFYKDLDFEVPLGLSGDGYDRCLVRIEECLQSISMISQLLDNVPVGEIAGLFETNHGSLEEVLSMKAGEYYSFTEAANGELGFFLVTNGDEHPYRLKIRTPSLPLMQVFPVVADKSSLGDALLSLKSLNIVPGELDR